MTAAIRRHCLAVIPLLLWSSGAAHTQVANPQATLSQYVAQLQNNPNDDTLREKIIKFAQAMNPPPGLPEEARKSCIEGQTLFELAQAKNGTKGFALAADAYRQCLQVAPWFSDGYNNYALALDAANQFDDAVAALRFYIATNPGDSEVRRAQDRIYKIGAKKKLAAATGVANVGAATGTAAPTNSSDALLRSLDGARYARAVFNEGYRFVEVCDIKGDTLYRGTIFPPGYPDGSGYRKADIIPSVVIQGPETSVTFRNRATGTTETRTFVFSANGETLTERTRYSDGEVREWTYRRER